MHAGDEVNDKIVLELRGDDYTDFIKRARRPDGQIHEYSECPGCGWREWRCSTIGTDRVIRVIEMDKTFDHCPRCAAAQMRAPEVFEWVCGVADKLRRDLEKK